MVSVHCASRIQSFWTVQISMILLEKYLQLWKNCIIVFFCHGLPFHIHGFNMHVFVAFWFETYFGFKKTGPFLRFGPQRRALREWILREMPALPGRASILSKQLDCFMGTNHVFLARGAIWQCHPQLGRKWSSMARQRTECPS